MAAPITSRASGGPLCRVLVFSLAVAVLLGACAGTPAPVRTDGLSASKLVQLAQSAADKGNYSLAMEYHQAVRDRFPDDKERSLWSSYEIAFLYHKMGQDEEAVRLLDALIQSYVDGNDPGLPQGPRVLAEKVKANILAQAKAKSDKAGASEAGSAPPPG